LRILFCGSDEFSAASLQALHAEQQRNPSLIESISVLVRPPKPTGRGYKVLRHLPLEVTASQLDLPLHHRDTFTGWTPPSNPNLIIAVSFGLFVPPRILRGAQYGGLNVHPSLLPDLYGAAPLHWALLLGRERTGVTVQTLSESGFDRGRILAQTDGKGIAIPQGESVVGLRDLLAPVGAKMLVDVLRRGLYDPKVRGEEGLDMEQESTKRKGIHARKLTPADRELFLSLLSGQEGYEEWNGVLTGRRTQILGDRAWANVVRPDGSVTRLLFHGVEHVEEAQWTPELRKHMDCVQQCAEANPEATPLLRRASAISEDYRKAMSPDLAEQKTIMWAGSPLTRLLEANQKTTGGKFDLRYEVTKLEIQRNSLVLPYFPDPEDDSGRAILLPVDAMRGDVVRIRGITVGGERTRPAEAVLRRYLFNVAETDGNDLHRLWESRRRNHFKGNCEDYSQNK
jgi:methionyl-tRNA formyltransferase